MKNKTPEQIEDELYFGEVESKAYWVKYLALNFIVNLAVWSIIIAVLYFVIKSLSVI